MVGKDIVTQSLNGLAGNFKNTGVQRKSSPSGDFSKTMSDVQNNQAKYSADAAKGKTERDASKGMKKLKDSDKPKLDTGERLEVKPEIKEAMKAADKAAVVVEEPEAEAAEGESGIVLASGQILIPELLKQGLEDLEEKVSELVTEIMDITEEELMKLLEESGMQLLDLLNPDNLKQFVLDANGCEDAISLITNEDAAAQLSQLSDAMENLETDGELGITKEEIADILKNQPDLPEKFLMKESGREQTDAAEVRTQEAEEAVPIVVEKETDSQSFHGSSKEESFQKGNRTDFTHEMAQDRNAVEVFVQNLAAKGTEGVQNVSDQQIQAMKEIVDQIVEQIKIAIKPESTSMELQLNPESLGKVSLTVVSKNGLLTASFTAENQIAKEAIESQMQVLKDNLNNQGVKVEAIEVNVSQFGFRQNTESGTDSQGQSRQQKKTAARRINLDSFTEEAGEVSEEEALAARVLRDNGGTVDYTA